MEPGKIEKAAKRAAVKIAMIVLGRALQSASRFDADVRHETARRPEGFSIVMRVAPNGPRMSLIQRNGRLKFRGGRVKEGDLTITFKNTECAFLVFSGLLGPESAFIQHRMSVKGPLDAAMSFIRCVNIVEGYLFPRIVTRRILKQVPPMTPARWGVRLAVLLLGVPLGV
jgi:hypothetical protein